jgi:prolyl oligopeptidase
MPYPVARRETQIDLYHGVAIADPYRWLESPATAETRDFIRAQNELTQRFLAATSERQRTRQWIRQRLETLASHEAASLPTRRGGRLYYLSNQTGGAQPVLMSRREGETHASVVLDPGRLWDVADDSAARGLGPPNSPESSTRAGAGEGALSLSGWRVSQDGHYLAYGVRRRGADRREIRVRDLWTQRDLPDRLRDAPYSDLIWADDQRGFYYCRVDSDGRHAVCWHRVGDQQADDMRIWETSARTDLWLDCALADDAAQVVIRESTGLDRNHRVFVVDRRRPDAPVRQLFAGLDAQFQFVGGQHGTLWFTTDWEAPSGRLIAVDLAATPPSDLSSRTAAIADAASPCSLRTVVPASTLTLREANLVGGKLVLRYLHDAASRVFVHHLSGERAYELKFAEPGTVVGLDGQGDDSHTYFAYSTYTKAPAVYRLEVASGRCELLHRPRVPFSAGDYETVFTSCQSPDGTRVPVTLVGRRGLARNGDHPTLLVGYGGFNIPLTPAFSLSNLVWLEMGGLLAVANVRGGGELGREWHEAGRRRHKVNAIDDFVAAAEWLVREGYTQPRRLAISGRSNGGLLVGAAMTRRPEMFAAALPGVAVLDMLRYHQWPLGRAWIPEYGSADDPRDFATLLAYSPLHQVRSGRAYPATLITTAEHDDRVAPAHSLKFAAALQACQAGERPVLLRVDSRAGHGGGVAVGTWLDAAADTLTFLADTLDTAP